MLRQRHALVAAVFVAVLASQFADAALPVTIRVTVSTAGVQANGSSEFHTSLSAQGRYVAFSSAASNLVIGDTNGKTDVFVRDTLSGTTTLVSVSTEGGVANNRSTHPSISSDGRYVAFSSLASDLILDDTNNVEDVFVRDLLNGTSTRVSMASSGVEGNDSSYYPSISGSGLRVAFISWSDNLVAGDTSYRRCVFYGYHQGNCPDVFVRDLVTDQTLWVSATPEGVGANCPTFEPPSVSGDGQAVAFTSCATNLADGSFEGFNDVFVRDFQAGTMTRVSKLDPVGLSWNEDDARDPAISLDGRYVAFWWNYITTPALGVGNTGSAVVPQAHVYLHDRLTRTLTLVTAKAVTNPCARDCPLSLSPSVSGDGSFVVFMSAVSTFVSGDTNGASDVFLWERTTGTITRMSISSDRLEGNKSSGFPVISADASVVSFGSGASNLVPEDSNNAVDVFLRFR